MRFTDNEPCPILLIVGHDVSFALCKGTSKVHLAIFRAGNFGQDNLEHGTPPKGKGKLCEQEALSLRSRKGTPEV